ASWDRDIAARSPQPGPARSGREVAGLDPLDACLLHRRPGLGQRSLRVDAAARILDDQGLQADLPCVEGGPADAEVGGEADEVEGAETAVADIASQPRGRLAVGFEKGGVGVHVLPIALT